MVNLLFIDDEDILTMPGIVKTLCDPACGTGGMLSVAEEYLRELNPQARLEVFGQELNAETYAICRSDMMLKGQDASHIAYGNSFSEFRVVDAAYEKRPIAISSNIHPSGFDKLMPKGLATATVERLLHHAHVLITDGHDSYRLAQATAGKWVTPLT
jgi:type I restriction-modification system DNA methylase subunit